MKKHRKMDPQEVVTKRIVEIFKDLKKRGIIYQQGEFAEAIGIDGPRLSSAIKGNLKIPVNRYDRVCEAFGVNPDYIKYGEEPVYKNESENLQFVKQNINLGVQPNAQEIGVIFPGEEETQFRDMGNGKLLMLVPKVDVYTMAGFLENVQDREYMEELPKEEIVVDKYHRGKYLAFEVIGESMTDGTDMSIPHGSIVIGREVPMDLWKLSKIHTHKWDDYIIVHKKGVLVKQISAHDVEKGIITIHSLHPDKNLYPDEQLHVDDINQIYNVIEVRTKRRR